MHEKRRPTAEAKGKAMTDAEVEHRGWLELPTLQLREGAQGRLGDARSWNDTTTAMQVGHPPVAKHRC